MAKRYAFFLLSGKRQKFPIFWSKIAEIPLIVGQKGRNSIYVRAKRQKFSLFWGKTQKFHLFWG